MDGRINGNIFGTTIFAMVDWGHIVQLKQLTFFQMVGTAALISLILGSCATFLPDVINGQPICKAVEGQTTFSNNGEWIHMGE